MNKVKGQRSKVKGKNLSPFTFHLSAIILLTSYFLLLLLPSCAKKPIQIGREHPEEEIKKCVKFSEKKHFEDAIECLEIFKSRFPKSQWSEEAELKIGDNYFQQKEYLLAADAYQSFIKLHPMHPKLDYAYYRTGLGYFKKSPKAIDRDQEYLDDAITYLEFVPSYFPDSPYRSLADKDLASARKRVARRHFYIGRFYFRTKEYIACIPRFKEVVDNYEDSGLVDKSLYYITLANLGLDRIEDAKVAFSRLAEEFRGNKYTMRAEKKLMRAVKTSNFKLQNPK